MPSTRFFRPLLYRLSYLGGALILRGPAHSHEPTKAQRNHCATERNGFRTLTLTCVELIAHSGLFVATKPWLGPDHASSHCSEKGEFRSVAGANAPLSASPEVSVNP